MITIYFFTHIFTGAYYYFSGYFLWLLNSLCIGSRLIRCSLVSVASNWNIRQQFESSAIKYLLFSFLIIFIFNVLNNKSIFCSSLLLFACRKTLRIHFSPEYIDFHMNLFWAHMDQVLKCNYQKTKWLRYSGTPCKFE